MKEHKHNKEKKKKPGEFKKQQKKHQNMQHNRDQMKLMKDGLADKIELFVLDPDAFKKVMVVPLPDNFHSGMIVAYLHNHGKGSKIRTGYLIDKDGFKVSEEPGGHIDPSNVIGLVVKEEVLKEKTEEQLAASRESYNKMIRAKLGVG
jgi:hypothetical protein